MTVLYFLTRPVIGVKAGSTARAPPVPIRVQPSKPVTVTFSYRTYMYHRNIANQEEGFHVATFVDHTACIHTLFTDGSPGFLPLYASKIHELIRDLTDRSQVLLPPRFHLLPEQSCYCRSCAAGSARLR
jgi:hypothetical protein